MPNLQATSSIIMCVLQSLLQRRCETFGRRLTSTLSGVGSVLCHFQSPERVFENFMEFVGDAFIVAHNARYDKKMINNALKKIKERNEDAKLPIELPEDKVYCSMVAYKVLVILSA
eukprot:TRINITY_DN15178_c0_g1_i1.p1 TRINITY_DN15178_c0_g1~~TRINITY_DN15178_c0_g1_i1.p1  ORF type:complete len:116 (-),score=0.64 TRINITY_DN15178_c0_g1_i1:452-799(-)